MEKEEPAGSPSSSSSARPDEAVADLHRTLLRELEPKYGATTRQPRKAKSVDEADPSTNKDARRLKTPGGFRRHHLNEQAEAAGRAIEDRPTAWQRTFIDSVKPLIRVGYFDAMMGMRLDARGNKELHQLEACCGNWQTAFAIIKSFVGSGITFMPGAFERGGWLFSSLVLVIIAVVNWACIGCLTQCQTRFTNTPNFSDIAQKACGQPGKLSVQVSLVISQFGIVIAYIIFITELVQSLREIPDWLFISILYPIIVPLCLIRTVDRLEYPNLVADVLILFGLVVVLVCGCVTIASSSESLNSVFRMEGNGPLDMLPDIASKASSYSHHELLSSYDQRESESGVRGVVPFKPRTCGIFVGMAIFTFEGIPMMLPIKNAMVKPEQFHSLFTTIFCGIALFFILFGLMGYVSWKQDVHTVVLLNLPQSPLSVAVKISYMCALVFSMPLMFLPATRITEFWVFGGPEQTQRRLAMVNIFRAAEVGLFCVIAYTAGPHFDQFLAFTGALCCAPVAFVYPALFHLVLVAESTPEKALDVSLLTFGFCAMLFTFISSL